ncbi:nucleotidyltransferase family protein [Chitinophaga sp. Cy-1792]|uniref:nucleotidyltransferase family protein n=1 Tax=Chitinophaga sp. Cy-1792 TaxID=2608339 RepID=UPI00141EC536|nr:nucleotidyltransferase domain-containing protein [Chitinophaga sp. Cy-1792]NIG54469.1 DNA polymerase subunit beta [Chitinophaga sp. Cy-1792]
MEIIMHAQLQDRLPALRTFCETHAIAELYAFGSVIDGRFRPGSSDIDLWIDLLPLEGMEKPRRLVRIWLGLQELLECKVDLILKEGIRGATFKKYLSIYQVKIYPV